MQPENNQNDIDTSQIKIPDAIMLGAVEAFAMGENKAQIAEELLNNLPEELTILADMDRQEAKALLCSRLRQADPNSTKFAKKYTEHYREVLKTTRKAHDAIMRTAMTNRVENLTKMDETLNQTADKLSIYIQTSTSETVGSKEMLDVIKAYTSICKIQNENTKVMAALIESFEKSQEAYENYPIQTHICRMRQADL